MASKISEKSLQDLKDRKYTDCVFEFIDKKAIKYEIHAHKYLLAIASPVFHTMFYGELKETSPILIEDISHGVFQKMIW